jgi:hypothetical protein
MLVVLHSCRCRCAVGRFEFGDPLFSVVGRVSFHVLVDRPYVVSVDVFDPFFPVVRFCLFDCISEVSVNDLVFFVARVVGNRFVWGDVLAVRAISRGVRSMASNSESVVCSSALDISIGLARSALVCTRFDLSLLLYSFQLMVR